MSPGDNENIQTQELWIHVGCSGEVACPSAGWTIADALETTAVHAVSNAYNLSSFRDASASILYSSHTLEHLSYAANVSLPTGDSIHYLSQNRAAVITVIISVDHI